MQVGKRAHKTCDPAVGIGGRKMASTVHLENIRCDGSAHDGCEAGCLIFWKEAWLKRTRRRGVPRASASGARRSRAQCTEDALRSASRSRRPPAKPNRPMCARTRRSSSRRNRCAGGTCASTSRITRRATSACRSWPSACCTQLGEPSPKPASASALRCAGSTTSSSALIGGTPYPLRPFGVPKGTPTPKAQLDLQDRRAGSRQAVQEILKTLDSNYRNRGLYFDAEMVPFTEREYDVERRQKQIIDEETGKMIRFKTDAIMLKDVVCEARYAICRRFCPRAIYSLLARDLAGACSSRRSQDKTERSKQPQGKSVRL